MQEEAPKMDCRVQTAPAGDPNKTFFVLPDLKPITRRALVGWAKPSTGAQWRSSPSAGPSVLEKCLTLPTLFETRFCHTILWRCSQLHGSVTCQFRLYGQLVLKMTRARA
jgi:hypothetical protein